MTTTVLKKLGVEHPVMQVGMPGIARAELAAAVARAGGIGTVGLTDASTWQQELRKAKDLAEGRPLCAHLLLPYAKRKHVDILLEEQIPMVSLFWGDAPEIVSRLKARGVIVFQQVGSLAEAERVLGHGVDILIVQGKEAGGHVRAEESLRDALPKVVARCDAAEIFAAGGINTSEDVVRVVAMGATGVSSGTRFLLTHESHAHEGYKQRLLEAEDTILTELFGLGWPAPHRVVPNEATRRWCLEDGSVPRWLHWLNASFVPTRRIVPFKPKLASAQRVGLPFFTPSHPIREHPDRLLECTALYAGEHVVRIDRLLNAADVVAELAREFRRG